MQYGWNYIIHYMEKVCVVFVVGDREKDRVQGRKNREKKGGKLGGKKSMKKKINKARQMERMEDICTNKMHNELKM
jgi:hypothetical protein